MSYRLRDALRVEPLVFGWPAWWCNFAPGTSALHAFRFQLPGLRSYLRNPSAHVRASKDPRLAGGSFVGIPEAQAPRVRELLERMEVEYRADCAFAEAWISYNERLREVAKGQTMEPLYADVPEPLGGLVELGYDYDSRPSVRFDEGLAYRSSLYVPARQGVLMRPARAEELRPFYMSTPTFPSDPSLEGTIPFADAALRALIDLDVRPEPSRDRASVILRAVFPAAAGDETAWLTDAPPPSSEPWTDGRVRVRYLGHACLLVESGGHSVLVDPLIAQGEHGPNVLGLDALPEKIDLALVTHAHPDHFDFETLIRLLPRIQRIGVPRSGGTLIGDVSMKRIVQQLGYTDVLELESGDSVRVGPGEVVALPFLGEHGDILHGSKAIYSIRFGDKTLLAAADSACLDERTYIRARQLVGPIQHVFMNTEVDGAPISWPFDALFPKKRDRKLESTRKCRGSNVAEGLRMLEAVGATHLYVYAMGLEPWVQRITGPASTEDSPRMVACRELLAGANDRGVTARRLSGTEGIVLS